VTNLLQRALQDPTDMIGCELNSDFRIGNLFLGGLNRKSDAKPNNHEENNLNHKYECVLQLTDTDTNSFSKQA